MQIIRDLRSAAWYLYIWILFKNIGHSYYYSYIYGAIIQDIQNIAGTGIDFFRSIQEQEVKMNAVQDKPSWVIVNPAWLIVKPPRPSVTWRLRYPHRV